MMLLPFPDDRRYYCKIIQSLTNLRSQADEMWTKTLNLCIVIQKGFNAEWS